MAIFNFIKKLKKVPGQEDLLLGRAAQEEKDLEKAYTHYEKAAELGNTEAMVAIGQLYAEHRFRPIKTNNLLELLIQGMPIFPWSLQEQENPDMATALTWFRKAAEAGNVDGMVTAGVLLCEGSAGKPDLEAGMDYLDRAIAKGDGRGRAGKALYSKPPQREMLDDYYDRLLKSFQEAVESGDDLRFGLYETLKSGSDAQLTRLGYVLSAAHNIDKPGYQLFRHLSAQNGLPLLPVYTQRANWQTCVNVNLNGFSQPDTYLAFSSDIGADCTLDCCHRLEKCGTAVYRSPAFGWLREEKHAVLLRIAPDKPLDAALLEDVIANYRLVPSEYEGDTAAFFTEHGEKEYSVEIAAITGDKVDILSRYTVGGSEHVREYFTPELLSLNIN